MRFILLFLSISIYSIFPVFSQETRKNSEFALSVGATRYRISSYNFKNGYRVGVSFNEGIRHRIYKTIQLNFGEDDGTYRLPDKWIEKSTIKDLNLNIGLGLNVLNTNRHRLFFQATIGGSIFMGDESSVEGTPDKEIQAIREYTRLGFNSTLSSGYRFYVLKNIGVGIGYDFIYAHNIGNIHSFNASLAIKL